MKDLLAVDYIPVLSVRPAELRALEELPEKSKDLLFPHFTLRPWTTANHLDNVLSKMEAAYGDRPVMVDAGRNEPISGTPRPVHSELAYIRSSADGYRNWYEFLVSRPNFIPTLQLFDLAQLTAQIELLSTLGRGIVVRLPQLAFGQAPAIVARLLPRFGQNNICVILDYEQASRDILSQTLTARSACEAIYKVAPECSVAVSASSFPMDFVGRVDQEIYERRFFNTLRESGIAGNLIYSDRGSARAERQTGGGGSPAPRVDLAGTGQWEFFREDEEGNRDEAYFAAAKRAKKSRLWDPNLRVWGTQMIERTAAKDATAIVSPARSTAVRINIHLQQQIFFDNPQGKYDTDEDWED